VDIVAANGLEWTKVSTLTEKRLLFEIAKQGFESYSDFNDPSDTDGSEDDSDRDAGRLELVRMAEDLKAAAKSVRVQFQHPRVRFVLPKLSEGVLGDVDAFIADLRATGAEVQCGTAWQSPLRPDTSVDFDRLMPALDPVPMTDQINIDCTILLALISDISHLPKQQVTATGETSPTYHKAIIRQIETEQSSPLLPTEIYPLLSNRSLECTSHAAQRMREIVQCMGALREQIRADIMLGEGVYQDQSSSDLQGALREHSVHQVPTDILLPIRVVDFDATELLSPAVKPFVDGTRCNQFPRSVAARAASLMRLTPINLSVFVYGWRQQMVTLTSNRAVAAGLLRTINDLLDEDEDGAVSGTGHDEMFLGPRICICDVARSLIGKAKSN